MVDLPTENDNLVDIMYRKVLEFDIGMERIGKRSLLRTDATKGNEILAEMGNE